MPRDFQHSTIGRAQFESSKLSKHVRKLAFRLISKQGACHDPRRPKLESNKAELY